MCITEESRLVKGWMKVGRDKEGVAASVPENLFAHNNNHIVTTNIIIHVYSTMKILDDLAIHGS